MADGAIDLGRVWADRLVAFYAKRVPLDEAARSSLFDAMTEAVAGAARADQPIARWPAAINAGLDRWEAGGRPAGPRVAHLDNARGVVTLLD